MLYGAIEGGGTKMVCAVVDEVGNILVKERIPTTTPDETLAALVSFFEGSMVTHHTPLTALGIGNFGPLDINKQSKTYGFVTTTPKAGWQMTDVLTPFKKFGIPIGFDTDVNAAALGEVTFGAAKDFENVLYVTVGTGIGVGVVVNGRLLHGRRHPEAGHIHLKRHGEDFFPGVCRYHDDCFEGLASGTAIAKRWGTAAEELIHRENVWRLEAYYIGQALADYTYVYAPDAIVLGGGIMHVSGLFNRIKEETRTQLGAYLPLPYLTRPGLGDEAGIVGAACLAMKEAETAKAQGTVIPI